MTKSEAMDFIKSEISKAEDNTGGTASKLDDETKEFIRAAIKELMAQEKDKDDSDSEPITKEEVAEMMKKALEPVYKSRGIVTNLNGEPEPVGKSDDPFEGLFV